MADITMCDGYDCDKKEQCYRFTAVADPKLQSWFVVDPRKESKDGVCKYFLDKGGKRGKR